MSQVRDKKGQLAENVYYFPLDEQIDNLTGVGATAVKAVPTRPYKRIVQIVGSQGIEIRNTNSNNNAKAYLMEGGRTYTFALRANQELFVAAQSGNNRTVSIATLAKVADSLPPEDE